MNHNSVTLAHVWLRLPCQVGVGRQDAQVYIYLGEMDGRRDGWPSRWLVGRRPASKPREGWWCSPKGRFPVGIALCPFIGDGSRPIRHRWPCGHVHACARVRRCSWACTPTPRQRLRRVRTAATRRGSLERGRRCAGGSRAQSTRAYLNLLIHGALGVGRRGRRGGVRPQMKKVRSTKFCQK